MTNIFREVLIGDKFALRFYPSDNGWMCGITNEMIDALEQSTEQETETCMGCNGIGVVGNILDTDICPFCEGSGIEQSTQEPMVYELADKVRIDLDRQSCPGVFMNIAWESIVKNYTPQPQEAALQRPQNCGTGYCSCIECVMKPSKEAAPLTPLTDEQIKIIWRDIDGSDGMLMRFARAIEAAHGITGEKP